MRIKTITQFSLSVVCLTLLGVSVSYGQIKSATITGIVTDPSGADVPGATVVVIQQATNVQSKTKTGATGGFTAPYLAPGQYTVRVSAPGFKQYVAGNVTLRVDQTVRLAVQLALGTQTQMVHVSAATVHLQTETSSVQAAITARMIENIPNITQDPFLYARLLPNVSPSVRSADTTGTNSFGIGVQGRAQYTGFGVNGGRPSSNEIQLDGLPIMGGGYNEPAIVPNVEGIAEERVISNDYSAQYGHGEAVVQISTKSGTNHFHGGVNYQLRNATLNANTFANNQQHIAKPAFSVNEIGGDVGGAIIKNKLFFFSSYDYLRHNVGIVNLETVPTALQRVGNFSQTLTPGLNGAPVPVRIYNPFRVTQIGPNEYQRAPYPNATVPITANNQYIETMMGYYPLPNRTPIDPFGDQNFESSSTETFRRQSLDNRIDFYKGINSIYASGGLYYGKIVQPVAFGKAPFNNSPSTTEDKNPYAEVGDTITLSPTLLADVRVGYFRINTSAFGGNKSGFKAQDYAAFGVPAGLFPLMAQFGAAPAVYPQIQTGARYSTLSNGLFANKHERQQGWSLEASITKVAGRLTTTAGVDERVLLSNYHDFEEASVLLPACCVATGGDNNFSTNFTSEFVTADGNNIPSLNATPAQQGYGGAALFTGAEQWEIRPGENVAPAYAQKYLALYTQNNWHVNRKLTLNLGLRWDLQPGPTERYNRMSSYDFTKPNPLGGTGILAFPGTNGYNRNLWNTEWTDFQPRLGAAFMLTPNTVIRAGFGLTYLPTNTGYYSGPTDYGASSFAGGTNIQPYGLSPHGVVVQTTNDMPLISAATGSNSSAPQIYGGQGGNLQTFARNYRNAKVYQFNFEIQRKFGHNWLATVGYNGSRGRDLTNGNMVFEDLQNLPSLTLDAWRAQYIASNGTIDPSTEQVPNPYQPTSGPLLPFSGALAGSTVEQFIPLLPYPLLYNSKEILSNGFSSYDALEVLLSHKFSSGLQLNASYVWSKALGFNLSDVADSQGFNYDGQAIQIPNLINNQANSYVSASDIPNRFTLTGLYELPFGTGRRFAISNPMLRAFAGGWSTGFVAIAQGGFPFFMSGASSGSINGLPNKLSGVPVQVPASLQHWYNGITSVTLPCGMVITPPANTFLKYNACAFRGETITTPNGSVVPNVYWLGNSAQDQASMRGPGRFDIDMNLSRTVKINERFSLRVSANATNLLNNPQFDGGYNGGLGSTNLVANAAQGLLPGDPTNSGFGTRGGGTYDPRQITFNLWLRF